MYIDNEWINSKNRIRENTPHFFLQSVRLQNDWGRETKAIADVIENIYTRFQCDTMTLTKTKI